MLRRRQLGRGLVGRDGGRHEEHSVKGQGLADLVGEEQVAEVDRVERAAEDTDLGHRGRYSRTWPSPIKTNLVVVSSRTPTGPRACRREVEMPISAPMPNCEPSTRRVEALTRTAAASTSRVKRRLLRRSNVTMASARPDPWRRIWSRAASSPSTTRTAMM